MSFPASLRLQLKIPGFDVGQEVYGMNDWFSDGATAEYCITQPSSIAQKPTGLTHVEAASVPIGALTAWRGCSIARGSKLESAYSCMAEQARGLFAIQLARFRGAHVVFYGPRETLHSYQDWAPNRSLDYQQRALKKSSRKWMSCSTPSAVKLCGDPGGYSSPAEG